MRLISAGSKVQILSGPPKRNSASPVRPDFLFQLAQFNPDFLNCADQNALALPNPHTLIRWNEHFGVRFNFERFVPGLGVSRGTDHPKLSRRMGIAHDLFLDVVVGHFAAPSLRPTEEHALIAA